MIKMPLEQLLAKLKEKSGLSDEELNVKLKAKMDQLSGLISKEGAAHIVANELGIQIFEATSGKVKIDQLLEGMRDFEVVGIPTRVFDLKEFTTRDGRQGKVRSFILGDETGTIRCAAWNNQADSLDKVTQGQTVLKISNAYLKNNQGKVELHLNDKSQIQMDPPGESITVTEQAAAPQREYEPATRKSVNQLENGLQNVEVLGTIVQVFDPRFWESCPQCNRKVKPRDGTFYCDDHLEVQPQHGFLVSFFLDDGTDNIRVTCFRKQAARLCNLSDEQMVSFKDSPMNFENVKTELLGQMVKVIGRVKKNDMFDRLEFTAQLIFPNPDPNEELNKSA